MLELRDDALTLLLGQKTGVDLVDEYRMNIEDIKYSGVHREEKFFCVLVMWATVVVVDERMRYHWKRLVVYKNKTVYLYKNKITSESEDYQSTILSPKPKNGIFIKYQSP